MSTTPIVLNHSPETGAARWPRTALYFSDVIYFGAIWIAVFALGPRNWIWATGLAFALASFAIWIAARRQLGRSFSIRARARSLVTTGLYRWFSHPIYLFGALSHLGVVVALQQWWLLPLWFGLPAPFQFARMKREDAVLAAEFGDEFRELRQKTIF